MNKYSIGKFATKVGLTTYTLRYYDKQKLIIPKRDENNRRYYDDEDVKWIGFILHLKGTGMLMTEIQEYVELRKQGDSTINHRKQLLQSVRKRSVAEINERKSHLEILSLKIDWYDGKIKYKVNENFEEYIKRFR
ncbi:MerR family transcriptional regulator [Apilactobacillus kunkeei]|uniref:MerR family transcriptional regulator n=1 Tax=Apilactobacillus kunkeei TaxID=148814 RepID=UPI0006B23C17|nr:MerR family transcriptional regulator [Apilactobacillus kunkeei]KOY70471.1 MerR regulatory family protein [Apilactobacillus kunkeei]CAI2621665.1 HTH-type transcriptional regulator AdhR [Apilactobacillus kunkeei]